MSFNLIFTGSIFLIFFSLNSSIVPDQTVIDSLKNRLNEADELSKIEILNELSKLLSTVSYEEALKYSEEALDLAQKVNNKKEEAKSLHLIGTIYYYRGNFDKALDYFKRSLKISEEINYIIGIAKTSNNIGLAYDYLGRLDQALEYHFKSLKIEQETGNKDGIAGSFNNIGKIYHQLKKI